MVTLINLPTATPHDTWIVPAMPGATYDLTKHVNPAEAYAILQGLRNWINNQAVHYGADPAEALDAARSLDNLAAWLEDLAGRRRITT